MLELSRLTGAVWTIGIEAINSMLFSLADLEAAAERIRRHMQPTPQYAWPLLAQRLGSEVWVKHENHTPIGAFKVRGGILYIDELQRSGQKVNGVITATRGNHGQSIARAARIAGIPATIVVPFGNSLEKNAAMRAFGAELIEFGRDFDDAKTEAERLAHARNLQFVPSFDMALVKGVASYALEFLRAVRDLAVVYVPIGMGSGICGMIAARDVLGLKTEIVGVVAENAPAMALSFLAGTPVATNSARTFADGVACREPHPQALAIIRRGATRIIQVSEPEISAAIRAYYQDTHNLAEGAGAAGLAALMQEQGLMRGRRVGLVLSGGNIDRDVFSQIIAGKTPGL
jgi:threonine dehydratase